MAKINKVKTGTIAARWQLMIKSKSSLTMFFRFLLIRKTVFNEYQAISYSIIAVVMLFITTGVEAADYSINNCPFTKPAGVRVVCAEVLIEKVNGGRVLLPVVRLGGGKKKTPVAILGGGGPGGGLLLYEAESIVFWEQLRRDILGDGGELILIDQSGAGDSKPLLSCPNLTVKEILSQPLSLAEEFNIITTQYEECLKTLNVDTDSFNTAAAADDMEAVRQVLGIRRWDVIGFSYGTRLALELIRRHPDGVRAALLDSVLPANADWLLPVDGFGAVLKRIAKSCGKDSYCARYGDLHANINEAMATVTKTPKYLKVRNPHNGEMILLVITPSRLADILSFGIYREEGVAQLPKLAKQLADGDFDNNNMRSFIREFLYMAFDKKFATALNIAFACGEWNISPIPAADGDMLSAQIKKQDTLWRNFCRRHWQEPQAQKPITSNKPMMLVAGKYDHATPLAWAQEAAKHLPLAQLYIVPAAHTPLLTSPCLKIKAKQFFANPYETKKRVCRVRQLTFH